jgi:hypothetical protein
MSVLLGPVMDANVKTCSVLLSAVRDAAFESVCQRMVLRSHSIHSMFKVASLLWAGSARVAFG